MPSRIRPRLAPDRTRQQALLCPRNTSVTVSATVDRTHELAEDLIHLFTPSPTGSLTQPAPGAQRQQSCSAQIRLRRVYSSFRRCPRPHGGPDEHSAATRRRPLPRAEAWSWLHCDLPPGGSVPGTTLGPGALLTECLEHRGATAEQAHPLRHLHRLRTVTKGHAATGEKSNAASNALREHGSFRAHFESLAAGCDNALQTILDALDSSPA